MQYLHIYLIAISVVAIILTLHDKTAAKKHRWRIKESTLMIVSALGGSVAMLITMRVIRHKTQHKKFMVGIPVIIALQIAAMIFFFWLKARG